MNSSVGQSGEQIGYLVMRTRKDYGVLAGRPADQLEDFHSSISERWPTASESERVRLQRMQGCLGRLESFLLHVSRVADHGSRLLEGQLPGTGGPSVPPVPGLSVALAAPEACADFESLLFHGRAALDRLTAFVSAEHGERCNRFSRLPRVLKNFSGTDRRARVLLQLLQRAKGLEGILTDIDGRKSLRSLVAHQTSVVEGMRNGFTIHWLSARRVLIFDCEALGYPVLATSRLLAREVPFVVLNAVAIYLADDRTLSMSAFEPPWQNPTAVFTDYIDPKGNGPVLSVCRMNPDGFTMNRQHVRPAVLKQAVSLSGAQDRNR